MKAPNLPSFSDSRPVPQTVHRRGSVPSGRGGKICGASISSSASMTCADAQVLDLVHRGGETLPELAQHVVPFQLVVGDVVELLFEIGGEIIFDVAGEKALQERHHDAAAVLRHEPLLLDAHIAAVLQHLQDRGIGGRPADAEFLHALDQRGFRIARRRLGEMLRRGDRLLGQRLAGRSWRAGACPPRPPGRRRGLPDRA